jgi:AcrR family transcriptional regulator
MATRKRLTRAEEDRVIEAYNAWNPSDSPVDELARSLGISRQTLYRVIERRNVTLKSQVMGTDPITGVPDDLTLAMSRQALTVLIDELVSARRHITELEEQLAVERMKHDGDGEPAKRRSRR